MPITSSLSAKTKYLFFRYRNDRFGTELGNSSCPNLSELHKTLFRGPYREAHEALADATDCAKCYFELKKRGVI